VYSGATIFPEICGECGESERDLAAELVAHQHLVVGGGAKPNNSGPDEDYRPVGRRIETGRGVSRGTRG